MPFWRSGKESACNAGDTGDSGSTPGLGRSPGVRNVNLFQYSCLENSMDSGAWQATVHGVAESDMTEHTRIQEKQKKRCSNAIPENIFENLPQMQSSFE